MSLQAVVKAKEKNDKQWKETADLISVSATGASFNLACACDVGTLIYLMVPLPVHLRCYDYTKELYRVWGLVQHCESVTAEDPSSFYVGVAFIGKNPPEAHKSDPKQNYRISGVDELGMWTVEELKTPFRKRSDLRYWKAVELYLALVDTKEGAVGGERTITENVSGNGASVLTTLDVNIGDQVKFISAEYDFSSLAVVCDRQTADRQRTRVHLKFVGNRFPVTKLMKSGIVAERV